MRDGVKFHKAFMPVATVNSATFCAWSTGTAIIPISALSELRRDSNSEI